MKGATNICIFEWMRPFSSTSCVPSFFLSLKRNFRVPHIDLSSQNISVDWQRLSLWKKELIGGPPQLAVPT